MRGDVRIERAPAQKINFNKLSTELDNAVLVEDFLWLPSYSHIRICNPSPIMSDWDSATQKVHKKGYSFLEFSLKPFKIPIGKQELKANIRNTGDGVLRNVVLLMHSLDENSLLVRGSEKFIYALMPGQEATVGFQVFVSSNAQIYFSLSGFKNGDVFFRTDSSRHQIFVESS